MVVYVIFYLTPWHFCMKRR